MTLEDFEKSLREAKRTREADNSADVQSENRKHHKKDHHRHHHHRHRNRRNAEDDNHKETPWEDSKHGASSKPVPGPSGVHDKVLLGEEEDEWVEKDAPPIKASTAGSRNISSSQHELKRDSWMQDPSAIDIEYIHKGVKDPQISPNTISSRADFSLKIHDNELNKHHLKDLADGKAIPDDMFHEPSQHTVDYVFGDGGSQWRMTKLKAVYRRARESGLDVDDVATEQYGDLRAFDDAREEETELARRETYGEGYVGKEKPSGELFEERKLEMGVRNNREKSASPQREESTEPRPMNTEPALQTTKLIDQSGLNRLKAQMMKAKLKGSPNANELEAQYNEALYFSANPSKPGTVILGAMENRMLAGAQRGEVKAVGTRRGRERGLVEENEDMSIEDMVREERRTRNQVGGDGQRFAERIAKDTKFDVSLTGLLRKIVH